MKLDSTGIATWRVLPILEVGNGLFSAAIFLVAHYVAENPIWLAALLGLATWGGFRLAFGTDPTLSDLLPPVEGMSAARALQILAEARAKIQHIDSANAEIPCPELTERLHRICGSASRIVDQLQQDPSDLRRSQTFLNTYLDSASKVAAKYAHLDSRGGTIHLEERFANLLGTIEDAFDRQYKRLLSDDQLDLDVEIELLEKQITREGLA